MHHAMWISNQLIPYDVSNNESGLKYKLDWISHYTLATFTTASFEHHGKLYTKQGKEA